tara:strand:+ start:2737 stop:2958 length:222 start_codon:yes stop_codon:yes gene_type:complete
MGAGHLIMFLFIASALYGGLMQLFGKGHEFSMMMSPIYANQYRKAQELGFVDRDDAGDIDSGVAMSMWGLNND